MSGSHMEETGIQFDLKTPCKNCPFRNDATRLVFACEDRAKRIEEGAYRAGFPCHLSAKHVEQTEFRDSAFVFGEKTQHCAGYIIMQLKMGNGAWPGIGNDEDLYDRLCDQVDFGAPVFDTEEEFFDANRAGVNADE